jgi:hypothetical protein
MGSKQRTVGSRQWAVDSGQCDCAVDSKKFLQAKFRENVAESKAQNFSKISYFAKSDIKILWPP